MFRVLLTTTSFIDTPGAHHKLLSEAGLEVVARRGPLTESEMLNLVGDVDGLLCGDDEVTRAVIEQARPRLRVISKYGVGLDRIDLVAADDHSVVVAYCPGVNQATVAEHVFALLLAIYRNIVEECTELRAGRWIRITGRELAGKQLGLVGFGRVGREVAKRATGFDLATTGFDTNWDVERAASLGVRKASSLDELVQTCDIVSLHVPLSRATHHLLNREMIAKMKVGAVLVNTARGGLVDVNAVIDALSAGRLLGYGVDVYETEPMEPSDPLTTCRNVVMTPHIGSRTYENVERQAIMAVRNLTNVLRGEPPLARATHQ